MAVCYATMKVSAPSRGDWGVLRNNRKNIKPPRRIVSVPSRGEWGGITEPELPEFHQEIPFPSPLEVTGGYYLEVVYKENFPDRAFPSPFEVTGVSYRKRVTTVGSQLLSSFRPLSR